MNLSAGRLAPRVIALAVAGYCAWPSVAELLSRPEPKPPAKMSALAGSLLRPVLPPPPQRDPFGQAELAALAAAKRGGTARGKAAGIQRPSTLAPTPGAAALADMAKTPFQEADSADNLVLEATCIAGDRRLAIINGHLYAAGQTLPPPGAATPPYQIVEILSYKVVLERDGKTAELRYSDVARARNNRNSRRPAAPGAKTAPGKKPASPPAGKKH